MGVNKRGMVLSEEEVEERSLTQLNNSIRAYFFPKHWMPLSDKELGMVARKFTDHQLLACRNIGPKSVAALRKHYGNYVPKDSMERALRPEDV